MTELPGAVAAAWAVLVDPTASLLAPLLHIRELFALSLVCKGLRPIWRQLCHMDRRLNNRVVVYLLSSGQVGPMVRRISPLGLPEDHGMLNLAHELFRVPRLEVLDLKDMMIENTGAICLANALHQHAFSRLHTLDLTFNFIDVKGVSTLVAALFPNRSLSSTAAPPPLRYLNLEGNSLGPKGTAALVEGMLAATAPPKLIRLDLAQNRLRNEGATAIARLFTEWKGAGGCPIKKLDLTSNHISDEGAVTLGAAIFATQGQQKHHLVCLELWYNQVGIEGVRAFCRRLEAAVGTPEAAASSPVPSFVEADFAANDLTDEELVALEAEHPQLIERGLLVLRERKRRAIAAATPTWAA